MESSKELVQISTTREYTVQIYYNEFIQILLLCYYVIINVGFRALSCAARVHCCTHTVHILYTVYIVVQNYRCIHINII